MIDAINLLPEIRKKYPVDCVDDSLIADLAFNNMYYRKAVATLSNYDQLNVLYHSTDRTIRKKIECEIMRKLIAEKFIRTFSNGDYEVEFDEVLTFDRGLIEILPSMPTQAWYTKPDNWRERNQIGLEGVKEQLQTCINSASVHHLQRFNLCLTHNGDGDSEEPIVWHESILDEYWNRLEEEIDQNKQLGIVTEIEYIGIIVEIKKERLDALVAILRSGGATNSSDTVDFDNVNLCEEGIISLSKLVEASSMLNRLLLDHNRIDNMDSARCLSRSLKLHDLFASL